MASNNATTLSNQRSCLFGTHGENHFDFIHGRLTISSVENEGRLFDQAYKALKPGGWFERNEVETGIYRSGEAADASAYLHDAVTTGRSQRIAITLGGRTIYCSLYKRWAECGRMPPTFKQGSKRLDSSTSTRKSSRGRATTGPKINDTRRSAG
jgi:hypothetical protein